ncbi:hypothetical protein BDK51DRAFT_25983 [Blyttiomyces helicus]|uniref:Uncharacterized protein n=1 Tax=Blyttiomyces helicus TaxID=388810 RepID=A0A4P9WGS2_9FUNG|nr:hypothetical protein BDK51DRAFT_25983 [Blyttiomyces helicus]|eukprot:RKO92011.1 hypothetical protein BDK51DRAFT_25983 [Blyttiomyces helicus]
MTRTSTSPLRLRAVADTWVDRRVTAPHKGVDRAAENLNVRVLAAAQRGPGWISWRAGPGGAYRGGWGLGVSHSARGGGGSNYRGVSEGGGSYWGGPQDRQEHGGTGGGGGGGGYIGVSFGGGAPGVEVTAGNFVVGAIAMATEIVAAPMKLNLTVGVVLVDLLDAAGDMGAPPIFDGEAVEAAVEAAAEAVAVPPMTVKTTTPPVEETMEGVAAVTVKVQAADWATGVDLSAKVPPAATAMWQRGRRWQEVSTGHVENIQDHDGETHAATASPSKPPAVVPPPDSKMLVTFREALRAFASVADEEPAPATSGVRAPTAFATMKTRRLRKDAGWKYFDVRRRSISTLNIPRTAAQLDMAISNGTEPVVSLTCYLCDLKVEVELLEKDISTVHVWRSPHCHLASAFAAGGSRTTLHERDSQQARRKFFANYPHDCRNLDQTSMSKQGLIYMPTLSSPGFTIWVPEIHRAAKRFQNALGSPACNHLRKVESPIAAPKQATSDATAHPEHSPTAAQVVETGDTGADDLEGPGREATEADGREHEVSDVNADSTSVVEGSSASEASDERSVRSSESQSSEDLSVASDDFPQQVEWREDSVVALDGDADVGIKFEAIVAEEVGEFVAEEEIEDDVEKW